MLDLQKTEDHVAALKARCESNSRRWNEIEISITPPAGLNRDIARRYHDLGVHRLILPPASTATETDFLKFIAEMARDLIGKI